MTAAAWTRPPAAACPEPRAKARGTHRPPSAPATPAASTMAGNGTANTLIATNAAAAIAHSSGCLSARPPMRHAACSTMATTAGLIP